MMLLNLVGNNKNRGKFGRNMVKYSRFLKMTIKLKQIFFPKETIILKQMEYFKSRCRKGLSEQIGQIVTRENFLYNNHTILLKFM